MKGNSDGEAWPRWWRRGAFDPKKAFHRAMMAPLVFPESIVAVDSWTRRQTMDDSTTTSSTVMMVIVSKQRRSHKLDYSCLPIQTAVSASMARKSIGVKADRLIAKLVDARPQIKRSKRR